MGRTAGGWLGQPRGPAADRRLSLTPPVTPQHYVLLENSHGIDFGKPDPLGLPQRVWQLIGGFHALPDWLPFIPESTALEGGRVRRLCTSDGKVLVERREQFNERQHYYTYSILEAPFAVSGHLATLRVYPVPGQTGRRGERGAPALDPNLPSTYPP